jgi:hypothetical protein
MLGTLKQPFFLKSFFLPPKYFPNINVAYECCYFPQTLFKGENFAEKMLLTSPISSSGWPIQVHSLSNSKKCPRFFKCILPRVLSSWILVKEDHEWWARGS